jgi:hypothetical protein
MKWLQRLFGLDRLVGVLVQHNTLLAESIIATNRLAVVTAFKSNQQHVPAAIASDLTREYERSQRLFADIRAQGEPA